jgi:hypothetical protein
MLAILASFALALSVKRICCEYAANVAAFDGCPSSASRQTFPITPAHAATSPLITLSPNPKHLTSTLAISVQVSYVLGIDKIARDTNKTSSAL